MTREELMTTLRDEYLPGVPVRISDRVFSLAWEYGHAYGDSEVEYHYGNFADFVTDLKKELVE